MRRKSRPAHCTPGSIKDARELGERLRISRERLAGSELAGIGQAWRLWAACADATFGYAREADQIYVAALTRTSGVHRSKVGPLLRRFDELGVFAWKAAPRGSHGISELGLPHVAPKVHEGAHVAPRVHEGASSCSPQGALQSNTSMCVGHESSLDTGTCRSSLMAPERSSEDWEAERPARPQAEPGREDWAASIEAAVAEAERDAGPTLAERFPPYHEDERTGDTTGDDEASLMRWAGANPSKTRRQPWNA